MEGGGSEVEGQAIGPEPPHPCSVASMIPPVAALARAATIGSLEQVKFPADPAGNWGILVGRLPLP
jgi:hypothetical protein